MTLMLDTSVLIGLERNDSTLMSRLRKLSSVHTDKAVIPFITYVEYFDGLHAKNPKNQERCLGLVGKFLMMQPSKQTAHVISDIRRKYSSQGLSLSFGDIMIAAQAIEHNMTLVTRDDHFGRINELKSVVL